MKRGYAAKNYFFVADGGIIRSISQLAAEIRAMPGDVYSHHVTSDKNDFSSWLQHEFSLDDLAAKIRKKSQAEASNIIASFLAAQAKPKLEKPKPEKKPEKPRIKVIQKIVEKPVIRRIIVRPKPITIIKRIMVKQKPRTVIKKIYVKQEPVIKKVFVKQKPIVKKVYVRQKPIIKVVEKIVKVPVKPAVDDAAIAKLMQEKARIEAEVRQLSEEAQKASGIKPLLAKMKKEHDSVSASLKEKAAALAGIEASLEKASTEIYAKKKELGKLAAYDREIKSRQEQAEEARQKAWENYNAMKLAGKKAAAAKKEFEAITAERGHAAKLLREKLAALNESSRQLAAVEAELGKKSGELKQMRRQHEAFKLDEKGIQKKLQEAEAAGDRAVYYHKVMALAEKQAKKAQAEFESIKAERDSASKSLNELSSRVAMYGKELSATEGKIQLRRGELRQAQLAAERMLREKELLEKEIRLRDELAERAGKKAAYQANFLRQVEKHTAEAARELARVVNEHKRVSAELKEKAAIVEKHARAIPQMRDAEKNAAAKAEQKKKELDYLIRRIDELNSAANASGEKYQAMKAETEAMAKEHGKLAHALKAMERQAGFFRKKLEQAQEQVKVEENRKAQLEGERAGCAKAVPPLKEELAKTQAELAVMERNRQAARQDIDKLGQEQNNLKESTKMQLRQLESLKGIIRENEKIILARQAGFVDRETALFSRENELTERELKLRNIESELRNARAELEQKTAETEKKLRLLDKTGKGQQPSKSLFSIAQK